MFRREFFFPRASHRPPGLMFFEMLSKDCDRSPRIYPGRSARACRRALQVDKGARGMPRLSEAKKDEASCDTPAGPAHTGCSAGFRMGQPTRKGIPEGRLTRGTETSKYPEEEKTTVIP